MRRTSVSAFPWMNSGRAILALAAAIVFVTGVVAAQELKAPELTAREPQTETRPSAHSGPAVLDTGSPTASTPGPAPTDEPTPLDRELGALREKAAQPQASVSTLLKLGDRLLQGSRDVADGRLVEEAERAYQRAITLNRKCVEAMVGLARVCHYRHEFEEGNIWAGNALVIDPHNSRAHALLGDAAVEVGAYDEAFQHYQEALDLLPDLSSYSRASQLLWLTGDVSKACWLMEKAIGAGGPHPENTAWCRAQLARMLFETGRLHQAEQEAVAALRQAPSNPHALFIAGRIQMAKKAYDSAAALFGRTIEISPTHDALVALGDIYSLTGRPVESEALYQRVVDLHRNGASHEHEGSSYSHIHRAGNISLARFFADHDRRLDEALVEALAAYQRHPNVFVADTLAWCHYKLGQYAEAELAIQAAMRWNTPDAAILFHAGMIASKRGDRVAASSFLERAMNLNPYFHPRQAPVALKELKRLTVSTPAAGALSLRDGNKVEK